jgi:hypothetical protein
MRWDKEDIEMMMQQWMIRNNNNNNASLSFRQESF